ncbi:hypothetical protein P154DRAFT_204878 [Amniculicola lignicola CBS 123094]|uniref:SAP domain-containing protein n=1 Tax=Amniculicola lignicola CBS 123094 TaxID=1392246 RepID=A0A6A5WRP0_9PLEO|nr:hypothetical protein P154DRAFT_204878 [Amniculicola lignicola CBS 123094]
MPEYTKLKNAELEALLKGRGLPTGGKKADMVERLTADDEAQASKGDDGPKTTILHPEDEIDWDDDADDVPAEPTKAAEIVKPTDVAKPAPTQPTPNIVKTAPAVASGPKTVPTAAPAAKSVEPAVKSPEADKTTDAAEKVEEKVEETPASALVDYSKGLAATDIEKELEKRRARAARFKIDVDKEKDAEIEKNLLRAKKFEAPQAIDQALPERKRKRGGDGDQGAGRNKRGREDNQGGRNNRRGGGAGEGRGRGGGRRGNRGGEGRRDNARGDSRPARQENKSQAKDGPPSWMNAEERAKFEQRKNKFAAPATT